MNGFVRSTLLALLVGLFPAMTLAQCPGGGCGSGQYSAGQHSAGQYSPGQYSGGGYVCDQCTGTQYYGGAGSRLFPEGGANIPRVQDVAYYLWDPCWPERYSAMARKSVNAHFAAQVRNGRVLHQTVWNWWFVGGTDELTPLGMTRLSSLARRRVPFDPVLYLQTAQDLNYDPENPQQLVVKRQELNQKRTIAIQRFLGVQTSGRHPVPFQVVIHDPPAGGAPGLYPTGTPGTYQGQSIQEFSTGFRGNAIQFQQAGGGLGGGGGGGGGGGR
ncbi:MAG: hypothetical protein ACFCD0_10415 [Gemmataceae bacterium]